MGLFYTSLTGCFILTTSIWTVFYFYLFEILDRWVFISITILLFHLLIGQIGAIPISLFKKNLKFGILFWPELVFGIINIAVIYYLIEHGVGLASNGVVAFCLARGSGYLFRNIIALWLSIKFGYFSIVRRALFWKKNILWYYKFGFFSFCANLLSLLTRFSDQFIISYFIGLEFLGLYKVILDLMLLPVSRLNSIFNNVYFPILSKLNKDRLLYRSKFIELINLTAFITLPIVYGIFSISHLFSSTFLDNRWGDINGLMLAIMIAAIFRTLLNPLGVFLLSQGKAHITMYWGIMIFSLQTIFMSIGGWLMGTNGLLFAFALVQVLFFLISYGFIIKKNIDMKPMNYYSLTLRSNLIALFMGSIVYIISKELYNYINPWLVMTVSVTIGMIIYMACSKYLNIKTYHQAISLITKT